jgi:hypothetical protein
MLNLLLRDERMVSASCEDTPKCCAASESWLMKCPSWLYSRFINLWAYARLIGPLVLGKGGGGRVHANTRLKATKKLPNK